jgi:hypothetical protein
VLQGELHQLFTRNLGRRVAFRHVEVHELAHLPEDSAPPADGVVLGPCSGSASTRRSNRWWFLGSKSSASKQGARGGNESLRTV